MLDRKAENSGTDEDQTLLQSPGERLRAAREERGSSLKDMSGLTHQSVDKLKALETMQTDGMSATLIRMHAVRYAEALDLPGDEIADAFAGTRDMMRVSDRRDVLRPSSLRKLGIPVLGLAICLTGFAAFSRVSQSDVRQSQFDNIPISTRVLAQADTDAKKALARREATPLSSELSLRAKARGWLEVRGSDGTIFRSRMMSPGEVYYPRMGAGWTLTTQNGSDFELLLDGQAVMALSETAQPLYSVSVDGLFEIATARREKLLAEQSWDPTVQ
ncbi:MAG: RodZ domain-containing protein [Pseudomonadota bacterium]